MEFKKQIAITAIIRLDLVDGLTDDHVSEIEDSIHQDLLKDIEDYINRKIKHKRMGYTMLTDSDVEWQQTDLI